jgi:hypothetical protein
VPSLLLLLLHVYVYCGIAGCYAHVAVCCKLLATQLGAVKTPHRAEMPHTALQPLVAECASTCLASVSWFSTTPTHDIYINCVTYASWSLKLGANLHKPWRHCVLSVAVLKGRGGRKGRSTCFFFCIAPRAKRPAAAHNVVQCAHPTACQTLPIQFASRTTASTPAPLRPNHNTHRAAVSDSVQPEHKHAYICPRHTCQVLQ